MITFLQVIVAVSYVNGNTFPWWVWLWAVIMEFDHYSLTFMTYRKNRLMIEEREKRT